MTLEAQDPTVADVETLDVSVQDRPAQKPRRRSLKVVTLPSVKRRGPILNTIDAVRLELERVYRAARHGDLPLSDACKFAFILTSLVKIHEVSTLERRIKQLESSGDA